MIPTIKISYVDEKGELKEIGTYPLAGLFPAFRAEFKHQNKPITVDINQKNEPKIQPIKIGWEFDPEGIARLLGLHLGINMETGPRFDELVSQLSKCDCYGCRVIRKWAMGDTTTIQELCPIV